MIHIKSFKQLNEAITYAPGDVVNIIYQYSDIPVPAKIISKNGQTYSVNLSVEGSPLNGGENVITIKSTDIVSLFQSNSTPAMGQPLVDFKARDVSNDIVINNYPKGGV